MIIINGVYALHEHALHALRKLYKKFKNTNKPLKQLQVCMIFFPGGGSPLHTRVTPGRVSKLQGFGKLSRTVRGSPNQCFPAGLPIRSVVVLILFFIDYFKLRSR